MYIGKWKIIIQSMGLPSPPPMKKNIGWTTFVGTKNGFWYNTWCTNICSEWGVKNILCVVGSSSKTLFQKKLGWYPHVHLWGLLKHIQKPPHGQTQTRPSENLLCKTLHFWRSGVTFQTCPAEKIYKPTAPKWVPIWGPRSPSLCDETKILTDTETFYPRQILPIPIPRLFFLDQIFRYRCWCWWCSAGCDAL